MEGSRLAANKLGAADAAFLRRGGAGARNHEPNHSTVNLQNPHNRQQQQQFEFEMRHKQEQHVEKQRAKYAELSRRQQQHYVGEQLSAKIKSLPSLVARYCSATQHGESESTQTLQIDEKLNSLAIKRLRLFGETAPINTGEVGDDEGGKSVNCGNINNDNDELVAPKTSATESNSRAGNGTQSKPTGKSAPTKQQTSLDDGSGINLSFCGCGFLGIYHVGVASCFHEYAPQVSKHKIAGSSAGALVATAYLCGGSIPLAHCTTGFLAIAIEARAHTLGPFHPSFDIQAMVREALERGLPDDAYKKADGRLHVSLTRVDDGKNVIISSFDSNEDLIQVLLCSCFIPFWSGLRLPKYRGICYMDGGFSNNQLELDNKTISVAPFAGEADICPEDDVLNLFQISLSNTSFSLTPDNLYRLSHALLPPEPEVLSELCKQGFADGIKYLQRKNLISCTNCIEIRSSLLVTETTTTTTTTTMSRMRRQHISSLADAATAAKEEAAASAALSQTTTKTLFVEQQEQQVIRIDKGRRDSVVSTASQRRLLSHMTEISSTEVSENVLNCNDCAQIKEKLSSNLAQPLPTKIGERIRESCEKVNKSLYNWIYSHRPVKYLSYLMVPYYLPIDISLSLLNKYWKQIPALFSSEFIVDITYEILEFLIDLLKRLQARSMSSILMDSTGLDWVPPMGSLQTKEVEKGTSCKQQVAALATDTTDKPFAAQAHRHHLHHHHNYHHHLHNHKHRQNSTASCSLRASTCRPAPPEQQPVAKLAKLER